MIEATIAIMVVLAGVLYFAFKLENRVAAIESKLQDDAQIRDAHKRDERIDRIESAMKEQAEALRRIAPKK
jgi:cbb3-type cytochrome oxidase subunit 3